MPGYVIVGIDPGATAGIALLDLSGRKKALSTFTGGIAQAVSFIEQHGTPSLVACDVRPPPEMAQKLASYFSCRLYSPPQDIREEEKRRISQGALVRNNHERDAYSAAVLAYRANANKLRQVGSLEGFSWNEKEELMHLALRGYRLKDAIISVSGGGKQEVGQQTPKTPRPGPHPAGESQLRARLSALARENSNLRMLVARLEDEKGRLSHRLRLLENGVRQAMMRDSEIRRLRFRLQKCAEMLLARKKGMGRKGRQAKKPRQHSPAPAQEKGFSDEALYNLGAPEFDLEQLVAEYRKGRK